MNPTTTIPTWVAILVPPCSVLLGYLTGLMHAFWKHWYCPRCHYYLTWRNAMRREVRLRPAGENDRWHERPW